jgi:hypothetical protein
MAQRDRDREIFFGQGLSRVLLAEMALREREREREIVLWPRFRVLWLRVFLLFCCCGNQDYTEFQGVEDAISFISDYMKTHGPYDGLVGFSQVLAPVALSLSLLHSCSH